MKNLLDDKVICQLNEKKIKNDNDSDGMAMIAYVYLRNDHHDNDGNNKMMIMIMITILRKIMISTIMKLKAMKISWEIEHKH